jgi:hypothetical protein
MNIQLLVDEVQLSDDAVNLLGEGGGQSLMGPAKPHAGGGPGPNVPMLQHIFQHLPPPVVKTLATANVEARLKIRKHRSG